MDKRIYKFHDGQFRFCTAHYGSWANDQRIVFRVRIDSTPEKRAAEKGIMYYDRLFPSYPDEIQAWKDGHPTYPVLGIVEA